MTAPASRPLPGLPATNAIVDLDLKGVSEGIHAGRFSSVEATEAYLARIQQYDGVLQAYITVMAEMALAQARQADAELARGENRGPLHGVPIALKDLIAVKGVRLTGGSQVFAHHIAEEDSPIVTKLAAAGAVMLGKLTMHEFAFGRAATDGSLEDGPFPTGRNPWNVERVTGGSSSGSGIAPAAGLCAGALGSDTGGSIRGPASLCGLVGHKPTYGLVTRRNVLPQCWGLDHVGPMTRGVWDAAVLLQAIAGHDPSDPSTSQNRVPSYTRELEHGIQGLRFGVLRRYYLDWPDLNAEVKAATYAAYATLERLGAELVEVDAPTLDQAQGIWGALLAEMHEYHRALLKEQPQHYRVPTRLLMLASALFPAADLVRAQRLRARLGREIAELLRQVDAFVLPGQAEPATPFPTDPTPVELVRAASRYTNVWNLVGLPACVLPSGFSREGLPTALQIVGRPFDDATVLRIARAYERATPWHTCRPDPAGWRLEASWPSPNA
jgi:aspartyl-tRNA(Asn)/glutamyl-tRNA(Gln) amidotransferase subunit A